MASRSSHWVSRATTMAGSASSASWRVSNIGLDSQTATMSSAPLPFRYSSTLKLNSSNAMYFVEPS